jgi:hypothetical protein
MQRMIGLVLLTISTLVMASSCSKDPLKDMAEEESRIYITNHDSTANFGSYKTYSIVDSVSLIDNGRFAGREAASWDLQVISAIQNAMNARGYSKVDRNQNPDLGINVSRVYSTSTNLVSFSNYWDYYGGYYDPFYWGYSGYDYYFPPTYGVYQSTEAALSIDMLDLKNASGSQTIKGVWNGLIRGEGIFVSSNVESQVQALFDQSPYLKTN